ncbi:MAG: cobalamin biosynthesis protein, partial [Syntrophales bacterium]|nr:cobalamin biosynthesis protein [Syntrophales bacterium]
MPLEYQIITAVLLDLICGDPRWFPHPVKFIGRFALFCEPVSRKLISNPRLAGVITVIFVLSATAWL